MDAGRWQRVCAIFAEALERPTVERDDFVRAESVDDDSLRDDVESLLASHRSVGGFLERSPLDAAPPGELLTYLPPGYRIGAYRLIRPIGRGGMGAVYLSERADDQYHKLVAIKVVSRGLDTDAIVRRFKRERQILADLDHPNIARLLEGGTTSDSLPYFVMEYIDGVPITAYCTARNLPLRERLDLFRSVCAAVQYAHQRLIVHCDIKPGNILVTDDGAAKLLDFGIARLIGAASDESGVSPPARALTVDYASPEQLSGLPVTTLTDVYSLGVVLYELLSGARPFAIEAHAAMSPDIIGAARAASAILPPSHVTLRQTPKENSGPDAPMRDLRPIRGDLDSIVLKAIAPLRERRYASAQLLGDDVRNYLRRHPVLARQQSVAYRAGKLVRRNALASVAVFILALSLVSGIAATSWQAHIAEQQRESAVRRFNDIRSLALSLISEVNDSIAALPGTVSARRLIVVRALASLDALARDAHGDRGLQQDLAGAYIKVGDVQGHPYRPNLGETHAAMQSYSRARQILFLLNKTGPRDPRTIATLALATDRMGAVSLRARDWRLAEYYERIAVALGDTLVRADPRNPEYQRDLSDALIYLGDALAASDDHWSRERILSAKVQYGRALAMRKQLLTLGSSPATQRALSSAYNRMAYTGSSLFKVTGVVEELKSALANHRASQRIRLALLAANPESALDRRLVADGWMDIAQVQQTMGDTREAMTTFEQAGPLFQALAQADRANMEARRDLAYFHENIGDALSAARQGGTAADHERIAIAMLEAIQHSDSGSNEEYFHLVHAHRTLGAALEQTGDMLDARDAYRSAMEVLRRWQIAEPNNVRALRLGSEVDRRLARLARRPTGAERS